MNRLLSRVVSRLVARARPGVDAPQRGATLVEYALLVSLFVVVSLGAIEGLQSSSQDRFAETSDNAGAPVEPNGVYGQRGPTPTGGGPGVTTPDPTPVSQASVALGPGSSSPGSGQRWDASVTVTATDSNGAPVLGATITLSWSGGETGQVDLVTGPDGSVSHVVEGIHQSSSLTFTLVSATAEGYSFVITNPTATVSKG